jgi:hypothetical protein
MAPDKTRFRRTRTAMPCGAWPSQATTDLSRGAEPLGGRNDGWGCLDQG